MAMSVVYATVNGRLVQENRGGVVTRYVADTIGSVIQTRDAAGNQTSSTTYWPFGEVRTSSGTNPSPWGFIGTLGYYKDALIRLYVRARLLRVDLSRWFSVDPLWPAMMPYAYGNNDPLGRVDPSGANPLCIGCGICVGASVLATLLSCIGASDFKACILCRLATNPALQLILAGCALACVACLGSWIIGILPKPVPVPVPAYGFAMAAAADPCKGSGRRRWPCTAKCAVRGPTPPWGYYVDGTGTGKTQPDACEAAKSAAIHSVNPEHMKCCTVGHCRCPVCTRT